MLSIYPKNADLSDISADLDNKQNKTDDSLTTTSKEIVGAINELNTVKITNITQYQPMSGVFASYAQCGKLVDVNVAFTTNQSYGSGTILFTGCPSSDWLNRFPISRIVNGRVAEVHEVGINAQGQIVTQSIFDAGSYELHCTYIAR